MACSVLASSPLATAQLGILRAVLASALQTAYYKPYFQRMGITCPSDIHAIGDVQQVLEQLPSSETSDILKDFDALRNPAGRRPEPRPLCYPLETPPRIAVLFPGFQESRHVRVFVHNWSKGLRRYHPNAVAGPVGVLRTLALAIRDGRIEAPPLTHAVVAFTGMEHGLLRQADRDLFWEIFQVPLFEQLRGLGGELLAIECEAHEGLHICGQEGLVEFQPAVTGSEIIYTSLVQLEYPLLRLATGLAAELHQTPCACGAASPRITYLHRLPRRQQRAMAAAAD